MRTLALLLTTLTGFTGLVYEVAWQKYLATLLGSHSEATAAVLAIFLGGLATGYALFGALTKRWLARSRRSGKPPRLLFLYGVFEAAIGLYALVSPWIFQVVHSISYAVPHGVAGVGFAFDVLLAVLLVGPPTVLMGATIPILTQALSRDLEDATRLHASVYGFNTVGAFAGALGAGFVLIPQLGLFWVMIAMGSINLTVGAVFMLFGRNERRDSSAATDTSMRPPAIFNVYAAIALAVGFAMMTVQTILIRWGGLSFGSSEHTFAMVVGVFVLCIALGSFAVSAAGRIPPFVLPLSLFALALLLGLLYMLLPEAPYWIHVIRTWFRDGESSFYPYYFVGFCAVTLAIAPAVLFSGALLPLIFDHLRQHVDDLGSVAGRLYSWNTVGSLLGALFGGYLLLFFLDLDTVFRIAILAVFVAASGLTWALYGAPRAVSAGLVVAATLFFQVSPDWDPRELSGGLFRARQPVIWTGQGSEAALEAMWQQGDRKLIFHEDDPTMTVTVVEHHIHGQRSLSIVNNGKSDGDTIGDMGTMVLAAALPALYAEKLERAFVIGFGTGLTAGELASYQSMKEVIVAEISPGVMKAAPLFDDFNHGASRHPKLRFVRSDAYRALMRSDGHFDLIVSEPSNPWVAGVEMLFSLETLDAVSQRLAPGGVYAQWLQNYEIDDASIALVLRTFLSVFEDVSIWQIGSDMILLGSNESLLDRALARIQERLKDPSVSASFARLGITSLPALFVHELVPAGVIPKLGLDGPLHTLMHPRLAHITGRAFYRGATGSPPFSGYGPPAEVGKANALLNRLARRQGGTLRERARSAAIQEACKTRPPLCLTMLADWRSEAPDSPRLNKLTERLVASRPDINFSSVREMLPLFSSGPDQRVSLAKARAATGYYRRFYEHLAPFRPEALVELWQRCEPLANEPPSCREGLIEARALVERGSVSPSTQTGD